MKKLLILALTLFIANMNSFATTVSYSQQNYKNCGHAAPMGDPRFCDTFKSVAYCHCHDERGMPSILCENMPRLLQTMIATYGSLWNACSPRVQKDVPQQECVDDWNFYTSRC